MAFTIAQLQAFSNTKPELRYVTEEIIDYLEANPGGGGSGVVETIVAGSGIAVDDTDPANPEVSATGGAGLLLSHSVTLTDDQIKNLPDFNQAVEIVPAPGAGKIIRPIQVYLIMDNTAGVYTGNTTVLDYISIAYGTSFQEIFFIPNTDETLWMGAFLSDVQVVMATLNFLGTVATGFGVIPSGIGGDILPSVNNNLIITASANGGNPFGGGNAANYLKIITHYVVIDIAP